MIPSSNKKIRTIIFGGGGFIGSHLTRFLLLNENRQIINVGRKKNPLISTIPNAHYMQADIRDNDALELLLAGADEVIDLAYSSVPKTSFEDPVYDVLANLPITVNLINKAICHNIKKFLLVSSGGTVYGSPQYLPIDEQHPTNPLSPYGITKLACEKYGLMFSALAELPIIVVRPSNPFGPYQFGNLAQGFVGSAMHSIYNNKPVIVFGDNGTIRDYIYIDDLCQGICAALDHGEIGDIFNIGTGIGHSNIETIELIAPIVAENGFRILVSKRPPRPFDVPVNVLTPALLTYRTGWSPKMSFIGGLRKTWSWVLSTGGIQ